MGYTVVVFLLNNLYRYLAYKRVFPDDTAVTYGVVLRYDLGYTDRLGIYRYVPVLAAMPVLCAAAAVLPYVKARFQKNEE
jgi:hypothetical protein